MIDVPVHMPLSPVTQLAKCKICSGLAPLHGVVDFNKHCELARGRLFPMAGIPIWYHRCPLCGFLFTAQFDHWTPELFRQYIYNADYPHVDPDYAEVRARANLPAMIDLVARTKALRALDYGGGNGLLAALLRDQGVDAVSWDAMTSDWVARPPLGGFDLVSAYEVLEHAVRPRETLADILDFVKKDGVFVFTTLTLDALEPRDCDHWYIAPRNGHVSIHTTKSLDWLFGLFGWTVDHITLGRHIARRG